MKERLEKEIRKAQAIVNEIGANDEVMKEVQHYLDENMNEEDFLLEMPKNVEKWWNATDTLQFLKDLKLCIETENFQLLKEESNYDE